jgi:tetratricopeptide (TPR) repeat protein
MRKVWLLTIGSLVLLSCGSSVPDIKLCEEMAVQNPGDPDVHYQLAEAYYKKSVINDTTYNKVFLNNALLEYKKVLEITPQNARVLGKIGIIQNDLGFYFEAQKYLEEALKINFKLKEERRLLAVIYYNEGVRAVEALDYAKGLEIFGKVLKLNPGLKEARHNLAVVYYNLGSNDLSNGSFDEGIKKLKKALEYKSNYKEAKQNIGLAYTQMADEMINQGKYDKALAMFALAAKYRKGDDIKKNIALVYCKKAVAIQEYRSKTKEAIALYKKAIKCCPDKNDTLVQNARSNISTLEQRLKKASKK